MATKKINDITAVILAGGKSARMGTEKPLLKIDGATLIERTITLCEKLFTSILISTNNPANYNFAKLKCIADIHANHGPISGIHSGLFHSQTEKVFVVSADLAFSEVKLIETIIEVSTKRLITLPLIGGIPQYTFGLYSKSLLSEIEKMILTDDRPSPRQLIKKVEAELIDFNKYDYFNEEMFINLNTPADYERAKKAFEKGNK